MLVLATGRAEISNRVGPAHISHKVRKLKDTPVAILMVGVMFALRALSELSLAELDELEEQIVDLLEEVDAMPSTEKASMKEQCQMLAKLRDVINGHQDRAEAALVPQTSRTAVPWREPHQQISG